MPSGLQVLAANSAVVSETSTRLSRQLGSVAIGTSSQTGSVTNAGFAEGSPWWMCVGVVGGTYAITPAISVTGNTIAWDWGTLPRTACRLNFGVY